MKQIMKRLAAIMLVMALAFGVIPTLEETAVYAAGKYTLKAKTVTLEVGQQKDSNVKTNEVVKQGCKIGAPCGYGTYNYSKGARNSIKYKVVSGKNKIKIDKYGTITGLKAGTAKIEVTATYYEYINVGEYYTSGKKLTTVKTSFKVKVKKASPVPKDKCKISDENMEIECGDDDSISASVVYNKPETLYAKPVLSYKVISGGEYIKVKKYEDEGEKGLVVDGVSEGIAEIEVTVTYQKYQVSPNGKKDKLLDKDYVTSTSKVTVTVIP